MNDSVDSNVADPEKPVSPSQSGVDIFPPFPDPTDTDFEEDIGKEERDYYKIKYIDLNDIKSSKLHCTACDRHLGCVVLKSNRMKTHPMLRTLVCNTCHTFYNSGEFEKGDDGSELYCRWCGQGGQVYCCSDCPHVFCAKCIKRNLGTSKIKEIENTDDWKCFKCTPQCLWDLRALCWATFRYCDFKNKIIDITTEKELKDKYIKAVENDSSTCCREKRKRVSAAAAKKKDEKSNDTKKKHDQTPETKPPMLKFPSTIQVKKFASINLSELDGPKKAQKRPASPKTKINYMAKPIAIAPFVQPIRQVYTPSPAKRIRAINPVRHLTPVNKSTFIGFPSRMMRPNPQMTIPFNNTLMDHSTNGFGNFMDHLNLSIENLTQGLDMGAVAALANNAGANNMANDDLVCTPDLPMEHLEPLCEVNEDNTDDDVQCISPAPSARNAVKNAPKTSKTYKNRKFNEDNIVQMTENDVTVNAVTGGLKFRVDPQTLSANKMYRLPDGRIFAINPNPNMPGGYSATIVALTDNNTTNVTKGATYAAKVSAVNSVVGSNPPPLNKLNRANAARPGPRRAPPAPAASAATGRDDSRKKMDFKVPVEWYRFNLVDAVDALEYSLMRLKKLKKDATTTFLRSRTVDETRSLHRTLDRLLNTSETRFAEIRKNLNKGFKQYLSQKQRNSRSVSVGHESDDDDDDVEILPDEDDDPIFIDENSTDSHKDGNDNQEVELVSSDLNDSEERHNTTKDAPEKEITANSAPNSSNSRNEDPLNCDKQDSAAAVSDETEKSIDEEDSNKDKDKNDKDDKENDDKRHSDEPNLIKNPSHETEEAGDVSQNDIEMSEIIDDSVEGEGNLLGGSKDDENDADKNDGNVADKGDEDKAHKGDEEEADKDDEDEADKDDEEEADKGDEAELLNDDKDKSVEEDCFVAADVPKTAGENADQTDNDPTADDTEMLVDGGEAGENESKTCDVDMSADIIDSLLNDEAFAQDAQNNDDNKSVGSGEFII